MRLYTSELVKKYKARTVVNHVSIDVNQALVSEHQFQDRKGHLRSLL